MDPNKKSILQRVLTAFLYCFLTICYWLMRIALKKQVEQEKTLPDPRHLILPPDVPIPSLELAQALNPKTNPNKLIEFTRSENPYVRRAVVRNPSLPVEDIERLAKEDSEQMVVFEAKYVLQNRRAFDSHGYELPAI